MKKIINYILVGLLISFAYNCEQDLETGSTNYVTFYNEGSASVLRIDNNATAEKEVKVFTGNKTGSDRTFTVLVDPSSTLQAGYSVPSTVTVPANSNEGSITVSVTDDENLQFVPQRLVLVLQDEAGFSTGESISLNIAELCLDTIVKLSLTFDSWAEEASWEIYDLSGTPVVIASGGQGGEYDALDNSSFSTEFCFASGDYGVVVYDSYGDGGTGYTISAGGATLVSGAVPDAGGGYPTQTFSSSEFSVD